MKEYRHWSGLPYLDALRPNPGWSVDYGLLASYSADLVVIVAALLALAGLDDDRGSGSKVDFATALELLRNKVRVIVQAGRVSLPPAKTPSILAILDRFIREVKSDEGVSSWHPKIALVRLRSEAQDDFEWRLWIGSRNLTRDLSWDIGLLLVGKADGQGYKIRGVSEIGAELAIHAELPGLKSELVRRELKNIKWQGPPGVTIEEIRLFTPDSERGLPTPPDGLKKLIAISPFLDGTIIKRLGSWGDKHTHRTLLSTRMELASLLAKGEVPLSNFHEILSLDAPVPEDTGPTAVVEEDIPAQSFEDEGIDYRGLHAKLIYAEHKHGRTLWLGSPNLTRRGWEGPNVEVIALLSINQSAAEGLHEFLQIARPENLLALPKVEDPDPFEDLLNRARQEVVAKWDVVQRRHSKGPILLAKAPKKLPHPRYNDIQLHVGILGCKLVHWPRNKHRLQLPLISPYQETEFIQIQLSLGSNHFTWVQQAPLDPPPDENRDRRALARYLDPRTFLLWIRSMLSNEDMGNGGGEWDADYTPQKSRRRMGQNSPVMETPTLEDILRSWSRDPNNLANIDNKIKHYLKYIKDQERKNTPEEKKALDDFLGVWKILSQELIPRKKR